MSDRTSPSRSAQVIGFACFWAPDKIWVFIFPFSFKPPARENSSFCTSFNPEIIAFILFWESCAFDFTTIILNYTASGWLYWWYSRGRNTCSMQLAVIEGVVPDFFTPINIHNKRSRVRIARSTPRKKNLMKKRVIPTMVLVLLKLMECGGQKLKGLKH